MRIHLVNFNLQGLHKAGLLIHCDNLCFNPLTFQLILIHDGHTPIYTHRQPATGDHDNQANPGVCLNIFIRLEKVVTSEIRQQ